jgi:beta-glucuronidase
MKSYPHYAKRVVHELDGIWDFAWLGEDVDLEAVDPALIGFVRKMPVPSAFDAYPEFAGKRGTAAYRTTVTVAPGKAGILEFGGLGMWNRIYVDGVKIAETAMPYSGVSYRIEPSDATVHEVMIVSDNRFSPERVPLQEQFFDFYAYGGIFRSVYWHEIGDLWIDRVHVTTVDLDRRELACAAILGGPGVRLADVASLTCSVDGSPVEPVDTKVVGNEIQFRLVLGGASLWSPESPNLHLLSVAVAASEITERFGIRTIATEDRKVWVNGVAVKLLGYCRHEVHPQFGPALPLQQLVQDIQLLRDQSCNFVRGAHYPQDPRFLDLCDEAGILVFEESLGWQQDESHFADPAYCDSCVEQTRLMVRNSFNHPSVIMWGFLNEGRSDLPESTPLYTRLVTALREEDSSRPVTFASNHPMDDANLDLVDIICVNNYPGWYSHDREATRSLDEIVPTLDRIRHHIRETANLADKPFIVSEIGAGAIYGWRDPLRAHWTEEYQADHLDIVCREAVGNDDIAGVALWQFCDGRTYSSSGALFRPRAFNNKGVLNEYRKPKAAYEVVKNRFGAAE